MDSKAPLSALAPAADFTAVLMRTLAEHPPPAGCYLNVNFPVNQTKRIRWTRQGNPLERGLVVTGKDPRGKKYYWIAERPDESTPPPDTDRGAVKEGCISLSLLTLDRNWKGDWTPPSLWPEGYSEETP
jgi:5'-nucleotidase